MLPFRVACAVRAADAQAAQARPAAAPAASMAARPMARPLTTAVPRLNGEAASSTSRSTPPVGVSVSRSSGYNYGAPRRFSSLSSTLLRPQQLTVSHPDDPQFKMEQLKQMSLDQQKQGHGAWMPELASESEQDVRADHSNFKPQAVKDAEAKAARK